MAYSPTAATSTFVVETADGRRLQAYEAGDPAGELVVVHHGTPGSGTLFRPWTDDAVARGIRLVTYDRPGFAGSDADPGRTVASAAADTAAIADALGVERFRCWGASGGGPHALACAALLPERVAAVVALASLAPWDADGLAWVMGMGRTNAEAFTIASLGERALREYYRQSSADGTADDFEGISAPIDLDLLEGEVGEWLTTAMSRGMAAGIEGSIADDLAFVGDWGFAVESIAVPTLVMHGRQDLAAPVTHGEWLADRIPTATRRITEDAHLSLALRIGIDVHRWLMAQPL